MLFAPTDRAETEIISANADALLDGESVEMPVPFQFVSLMMPHRHSVGMNR